jgi:ABC-type molybdate transport system substrate-binding protein
MSPTLLARLASTLMLVAYTAGAALAQSQSIEVYSAGSLRNVVAELAKQMTAGYGIEVKPTFSGSGLLRERIEHGEKPDLFLSADLGSPRTLTSAGLTMVPTIAFAKNRMCIVSRRAAHVTASNLIEQMLKPAVRVKTSKPVADPSGDYAWAIFDRIDALQPGKGKILKEKAERLMDVKATSVNPDQSAAAALFSTGQIDLSITYCSGTASLERELPDITSLEVPAALDPHPVYGLAVLSSKPEALRVALFLLSEKGQSIIAGAALVPILDTDGAAPK